MSLTLIDNLLVLVTMDDERREIGNGAIVIQDKAADLVLYRIDGIRHAGAAGDLVAGLLTCAPVNAWLVMIGGRTVLERGNICGLDLESLVTRHNQQAQRLLQKTAEAR